ncbi:MAG: Na+/H+ antiporter subunit D [Alphaproteobacteria bacterium]|nr:Na+/H+ antiporter subunit D [Alphaproteobacteria bacterium]
MTPIFWQWVLAAPIVLPLAGGAIGFLAIRRVGIAQGATLLASVGTLLAAILLFGEVRQSGALVMQASRWDAPFGITLVADGLSALLVMLAAAVGLGVQLHAMRTVDQEERRFGFFPLFHLLLAGANGAFLTGDVFNLYVWFEVTLIAGVGLLALGQSKPQVDATLKYVAINLVGTTIYLIATGLLYGATGSLNMADISARLLTEPDSGTLGAIGLLFVFSLALKSAAFPLFFWLPAAYHTPSVAVSAVFAGIVTKVGAYALLRVVVLVFSPKAEMFVDVILWVAILTLLVGGIGALVQRDLRRLLSYALVAGIGYILLGLGIGTAESLGGGIFYAAHHIVLMTAFFLLAGHVAMVAGSFSLDRMGGLLDRQAFLAILFFVAIVALSGLPPLGGFWAKAWLVKAALAAGSWFAAGAALLSGLLVLVALGQAWAMIFWRKAPASADTSAALRLPSLAPTVALLILAIAMGLHPEPWLDISARAAGALLDVEGYQATVLGGRR